MTRSLIGLPVRLGLRGVGIAFDGATAIAGRALGLAAQLVEAITKDGGPDLDLDGSEHGPSESRPVAREPSDARPGRESRPGPARAPATAQTDDAPQTPDAAATADAPATPEGPPAQEIPAGPEDSATPPAPDHVSEEPILVEEVAEAGAEDGAGAEVHVAEPWDGYRELAADDVIDRLGGATSAELAAVELYEQSHRRRRTVLAAVQRELARADR